MALSGGGRARTRRSSVAPIRGDNRYNLARTLDDLNASFTAATPIAARQIAGFASSAMALKPVFWVVRQSGVTMFPYWAGSGPEATTDQTNPTPDTWRQCVAVVPPGTEPGALPVTGH